jgi:hypothetical protein
LTPGRDKSFFFSITSRPALGTTQPLTSLQYVPGALSRRVKPGRVTDQVEIVFRLHIQNSVPPGWDWDILVVTRVFRSEVAAVPGDISPTPLKKNQGICGISVSFGYCVLIGLFIVPILNSSNAALEITSVLGML